LSAKHGIEAENGKESEYAEQQQLLNAGGIHYELNSDKECGDYSDIRTYALEAENVEESIL
jgi:hypothetical protein